MKMSDFIAPFNVEKQPIYSGKWLEIKLQLDSSNLPTKSVFRQEKILLPPEILSTPAGYTSALVLVIKVNTDTTFHIRNRTQV